MKVAEAINELLAELMPGKVTFYMSLDELPTCKQLPYPDIQCLVVFDDQVTEKNQRVIEEMMIRCRKSGKGIYVAYLTQSCYETPKLIRQQLSDFILMRLGSKNDLEAIVRDQSGGLDKNRIVQLHRQCTCEEMHFLMINLTSTDMNKKFSRTLDPHFIVDKGLLEASITMESDSSNLNTTGVTDVED